MASRRVGIRDVASRAAVSIATVSTVLNGKRLDRVSATTRERVHRAAEDLGYRPNKLARGLRTTETAIIGMVSDLVATTPYAGELIVGAQAAAAADGHLLMLVNAERDAVKAREGAFALRQYQVKGLIFADVAQRVSPSPGPIDGVSGIFANQIDDAQEYDSVVADERAGARNAVREMVRRGHRRIAFVGPDSELLGPSLRREAFLDAAAAGEFTLGADCDVVAAEFSALAGRAAALPLLDRPADERPTAVFAASDQIAVGVYQAAARLGLAVPADLSLVGFGGWPLIAPELDPPLTTVAIPYLDIGREAVRRVLSPRETGPVGVTRLPTTFVPGGSLAPPR